VTFPSANHRHQTGLSSDFCTNSSVCKTRPQRTFLWNKIVSNIRGASHMCFHNSECNLYRSEFSVGTVPRLYSWCLHLRLPPKTCPKYVRSNHPSGHWSLPPHWHPWFPRWPSCWTVTSGERLSFRFRWILHRLRFQCLLGNMHTLPFRLNWKYDFIYYITFTMLYKNIIFIYKLRKSQ